MLPSRVTHWPPVVDSSVGDTVLIVGAGRVSRIAEGLRRIPTARERALTPPLPAGTAKRSVEALEKRTGTVTVVVPVASLLLVNVKTLSLGAAAKLYPRIVMISPASVDCVVVGEIEFNSGVPYLNSTAWLLAFTWPRCHPLLIATV